MEADAATRDCCGVQTLRKTAGIFTKYVLLRFLGLSLYCLDMLTDVNAAYGDFKAGDQLFGCITIALVFAPSLLYSLYMACNYLVAYIGEIACLKAPFIIIISPLLPFWIILKDLKLIFEGLLATVIPRRRPALIEHSKEPSKMYLVKFLEAFTEAAPQLLVRLFRIASRNPQQFSDMRSSEIVQISVSALILSLKVVSTHQKSVSTQQVLEGHAELTSKYRLPWMAQIIALLWWLCFLVSRFEALALFSASHGYWVLLVVGIHVALLFVFQTIASQKDRLNRIFIYIFGAFVFIFAYVQFNLKNRLRIALWFPYMVFAIIIFIENSIILTFWFFSQQSNLNYIIQSLNETTSAFQQSNCSAVIDKSLDVADATTAQTCISTTTGNMISEEDLQQHWKIMLFIHYGLFGCGLLFMILTFCCTSHLNGQPIEGEQKPRSEVCEMEILTNSNIS